MIMPFVRLFAIYVLVGLAIFAFFKRDRIMELFAAPESEVALPAVPVVPKAPAAATPQPVRVAETPAPASAPETPAAALTQPVAEPLTAPVAEAPAAPVSSAPAVTGGLTERLQAARQAFWKGDTDGAEAAYKSLAADFPDSVDVMGELGNLYYSRGRMAEAAVYFARVGDMALATGNTTQVLSMMGILQQIAPDKAADLRARFDAAQGN